MPRDVDGRTDVWALGAILYELLTGHTAFVGDSVAAVLDMVLHDDPCPIDILRRHVPPELSAVVMRCLERDRAARMPSVTKLAAALAPFGTLSVVAQLASGSLRVPSLPSVQPMVTDGRDTQPDTEELLARDSIVQAYGELRARRRKAASAMRLVGAASIVAGAISILLHLSAGPPAAPPAPRVAEPLPPPRSVEPVQGANDSLQSARDPRVPTAPPASPSAPPSASSGRPVGAR
jgi:serine/threonine-protein kinase